MTSNQSNGNGKSLESWLWEAACSIRGEIEAPKYKDFIIPLIFLKRLNDVFEDELLSISESEDISLAMVNSDHRLVRSIISRNPFFGYQIFPIQMGVICE